jgi:hypothetical protein
MRERRCIMSIMNGTRYIDGSVTYKDGEFKGQMPIPSMINCDRYNDDNNNLKIVCPNKNDIGELSFKEFQWGQELLMSYDKDYNWAFEKLMLARKMFDIYSKVLSLKAWRTDSRVERIENTKEIMLSMSDEEWLDLIKGKLSRDQQNNKSYRLLNATAAIIEGRYEEVMGKIPADVDDLDEKMISFPEHLFYMRDFREQLKFRNWNNPELPKFLTKPYIRAMQDISASKKCQTFTQDSTRVA